ncbi:MAG TPA: hypothetical protein VF331_11725 [Polyangiales bacterium]
MKLNMIVGTMAVFLFLLGGHAAAQLRPLAQSGPRAGAEIRASALTTSSIQASCGGDRQSALTFAQAAIAADPSDPWGYYVRGSALLALRHVEDTATSFHDAELRFPSSDPWGTSVAIWGQANTFSEAIRCHDAAPIYQRYAAFVEHLDPAAAAMARAYAKKECAPPAAPRYSAAEIDSINLEIAGHHERALEQADAAIRAAANDAWGYYLRGDALGSLGRVDEAVTAFQAAERRFSAAEPWEKSIAIWGQAFALKNAGRCPEGAPIFERYAAFVEARDPAAAALAREYARQSCVPLRASH